MDLNNKQKIEIDLIFDKAYLFLSKPVRKHVFDIGYIKIKNKTLLGFHLECYPKRGKINKFCDIQFWIGEVKDFSKQNIDYFLEDFFLDNKNSVIIENLMQTEIEEYKNKIIQLIKNKD